MTERLKVAIAGTGYFSGYHVDAWTRSADVEMVAIATIDEMAGKRVAETLDVPVFDDAADMLRTIDTDLLDIVTPPSTHLSLIEAAAAQGVNAVCQKPFCNDLETAKRAVALAADSGITLIVHENFRFQPWYAAIRQELEKGRLGRVYQAIFRLRPGDGQGARAYLDRQPYFQSMPRFLVHETAVHYVDVMRFLFGEPVAVWADLRRLNTAISGEDAGLIVLDHGEGLRTVIDGNRLSDHAADNRRLTMGEMLVEGQRGTLSLDGDGALTFRAHGENERTPVDYLWENRGFGGDCVYRFTRHVVEHFLKGKPLQTEAMEYLKNLRLEDAVYRSDKRGVRISLREDTM